MEVPNLIKILWCLLAVLVAGSAYLIVEGVRVYRLFSESVVGRLVRTLVVVFLIQLYSLGLVGVAFITFKPEAVVVILPIVVLWLLTLIFSTLAIRAAKRELVQ
jgi:hypothetical protein